MTDKKIVHLTIDGQIYEYEAGTRYSEIAAAFVDRYDQPILLVRENYRLRELHHRAVRDAEVRWLTMRDADGFKTYVRSMTMLMLAAADQVDREEGASDATGVTVHFAVSKGLYCTRSGLAPVTQDWLDAVKAKMKSLVDAGVPIRKSSMATEEATALFEEKHMPDKKELMRYRVGSRINIYQLGSFVDYHYGYMAPNTSCLGVFDLLPFAEGFVLRYATALDPLHLPLFAPDQKLFAVQQDALHWGVATRTRTVSDVNGYLLHGRGQELILTMEAYQEKQIAAIAEKIASDRRIKFVMIAGPSSSGKTTFSHRLSAQLSTYGLVPHPVEVDSYFVNREQTPKNPDGSYNFECLEAIDTEQFNEDMSRLLGGELVELPSYNFRTGLREYKGKTLQLGSSDILVIEGIHGLNDKMSFSLPRENKFKIYISALTQLNLDEHNRIATTDARIIRRIVRDARTRGTSAENTIAMWPSVRAGEENYIFPYQESADVMFNSALIYELSVLKIYAEPLLFGIESSSPYYTDARKMLKFLDYFVPMPAEQIPANSLVREFIGGGCFNV